MPSVRTAADLVAQVRDHIQQASTDQMPYRDGFSADATDPVTGDPSTATPILRWINKAFGELLETGIAKCVFTLTLTPGQAEYGLAQQIHEIEHGTCNGFPLTQTTLLRRDTENPGWQNYPGIATVGTSASPVRLGLPRYVYTYSDVVGFDPAPDQAYIVQMLADDVPADLVATTDVPTRIPARYHDGLASRAAWWISNMDIENTAAAARMPGLDGDWKKAYLGVQTIAQNRQLDATGQVEAGDYRKEFGRGRY